MTPKKIWANLTVSDLDRTTEFYTKLGFKHNGASRDLTSFLIGKDNFVMHFFLKEKLEVNMKVKMGDSQNANEIMFALSADSREEVDHWAKEVETAGGKVITSPEEFGQGFYGFVFADPDGHMFNVFYM